MYRCKANTCQWSVFLSVYCLSVIAESLLAALASRAEKTVTLILGRPNVSVFLTGFLGNHLKNYPGSPKNDNLRDHAVAIGVYGYKEG